MWRNYTTEPVPTGAEVKFRVRVTDSRGNVTLAGEPEAAERHPAAAADSGACLLWMTAAVLALAAVVTLLWRRSRTSRQG